MIKTSKSAFRLHFTGYKIRIYYSVSVFVRKPIIISMKFVYEVYSTKNIPYNSIIIDTKVIIIECTTAFMKSLIFRRIFTTLIYFFFYIDKLYSR